MSALPVAAAHADEALSVVCRGLAMPLVDDLHLWRRFPHFKFL